MRVIRHVFSDIRFFQNPWKKWAEFNSHHKVLRSIYLNHVWSNSQIFNFSLRFWIIGKKNKKKLYPFVYFSAFRNIFAVYLERKMTFSEITKTLPRKFPLCKNKSVQITQFSLSNKNIKMNFFIFKILWSTVKTIFCKLCFFVSSILKRLVSGRVRKNIEILNEIGLGTKFCHIIWPILYLFFRYNPEVHF